MARSSFLSDPFTAAAELGIDPLEIRDFSSTVYPAPIPDAVREGLQQGIALLGLYPDSQARALRKKAAEFFGVTPQEILAGNGITEFLFAVPHALRARRSVICAPCPAEYWRAVEQGGSEAEGFLSAEATEFVPEIAQLEMRIAGADMVVMGNPNNPTGVVTSADWLRSLCSRFPKVIFVVDESHAEFVPASSAATLLTGVRPRNAVVLRSLSCFPGLPGLRMGFLIAIPEIIAQIDRARQPWTVGMLAQCAATAFLASARDIAATRASAIAERERMRDELSRIPGLRVFRSQTNFLLVKITRPDLTSSELCHRLLQDKVLICNAAVFRGLDGKYVRISIRTPSENNLLIEALQAILRKTTPQ